MIPLEVADLVLIASRTLQLSTHDTLDLLDVAAAETALTEAGEAAAPGDLADHAAGLLHALVRRRPFQRDNDQVAMMATFQLIALNGGQVDLGPPEDTRAVLTELRAGTLGRAELTDWIALRLHDDDLHDDDQAATGDHPEKKEAPMSRWPFDRDRGPGSRQLFTRFTDRARQATVIAQEEARRLGHDWIGTEHVLLGLIQERNGIAARALQALGVSLESVRAEVEEIIGRGKGVPSGHIPFTPRSKKVLELSLREALRLGHNYIGTEHILLGLIREGRGVAAQVLVKLGADLSKVSGQVTRMLPADAGTAAPLPAVLVELDERIAEIRRDKDAAIDAEDFERAAGLRRAEKVLIEERAKREQAWLAGDPDRLAEEKLRLQGEVDRLRDLLRQHGIDPDNGAAQSA